MQHLFAIYSITNIFFVFWQDLEGQDSILSYRCASAR